MISAKITKIDRKNDGLLDVLQEASYLSAGENIVHMVSDGSKKIQPLISTSLLTADPKLAKFSESVAPLFDEVEKKARQKIQKDARKIISKLRLKKHNKIHTAQYYVSYLKKIKSQKIDIDLFDIHCPHVPKATAKLEKQSSGTKTGGFEITLFGIGGGATVTKSAVFTKGAGTEKKCMTVAHQVIYDTYEFEIKCRQCDTYTSGRSILTDLRDDYNGFRNKAIPPDKDACLKRISTQNYKVHEYTIDVGYDEPSISITTTTSKSISASPTGFPFKLSGKWETFGSLKFSYHLPSGNEYTLYLEKQFPKHWKTKKLQNS